MLMWFIYNSGIESLTCLPLQCPLNHSKHRLADVIFCNATEGYVASGTLPCQRIKIFRSNSR
jgi:hypothetical protein